MIDGVSRELHCSLGVLALVGVAVEHAESQLCGGLVKYQPILREVRRRDIEREEYDVAGQRAVEVWSDEDAVGAVLDVVSEGRRFLQPVVGRAGFRIANKVDKGFRVAAKEIGTEYDDQ